MNSQSFQKTLIAIIGLVVIAILAYIVMPKNIDDQPQMPTAPIITPPPQGTNTQPVMPGNPAAPQDTPQQVVLKGTVVCLPHRNPGEVQTMECAYGLKAADGSHYALDTNLMSQMPPNYDVTDMVTVSGILVPIEQVSVDVWQKYDIKGIVAVTSVVKS